ncbi:hypothetical protein [Streptomyces chartreusis]|uniref:hypothetical protein n=1 Tax=Streptomyces chartreusis TaxID=1969 RepID=UPI002E173E43
MRITEPGAPDASTSAHTPDGPTVAHTLSVRAGPSWSVGRQVRSQTTRLWPVLLLDACPGRAAATVFGNGAPAAFLLCLPGGEFGDSLKGLGMLGVEAPGDLACHMTGAESRDPDVRGGHPGLVRQSRIDLQPVGAVLVRLAHAQGHVSVTASRS